MKKYILIALLFAIFTLLPFKTNDVFAVTCTQNGSTAYCADTRTGQTTTYNQYGNNIYGSDGSSYTTYGDTTYGSGNVFITGGNSGSSLPSLTTAGADLNSPEMIAAKAKYDAACAPSTSNEVLIGGISASNCREAVVEWLRAVSESQKRNSTAPATQSTNYSSRSSATQNESLNDFMTRTLSSYGYTNNIQAENQCVSRGMLNSHREGDYCICDSGYLQVSNKCEPLTIKSCESVFGQGAVPQESANLCQCKTGYTLDSTANACVSSSNNTNNNSMNPTSARDIKTEVKNKEAIIVPTNKKIISPVEESYKTTFNQQERDIIEYGLKNGKTKQQVEESISNYRLGIVKTPEPEPEIINPLKWYQKIFKWVKFW